MLFAREATKAAQALQRAVRQLLDGLPERGAPQQEAIAYCLSRTSAARNPRVQAEAERLARRHVAVEERILCIALSATSGSGKRPALLMLTDHAAAIGGSGPQQARPLGARRTGAVPCRHVYLDR